MDTIYLIQNSSHYWDYDSRSAWNDTIDEEEGFFTDKDEAEARALALTNEAQAAYDEHRARYDAAVEREREKSAKARELGFNHQWGSLPFRPDPPDHWTVVEIEAAK